MGEPEFLDDGPQKPVRIWSRSGRRPMLAAGNSNGVVPMLAYARHDERPSFGLLVLHDDDERELAYTTGAERALEEDAAAGGTVVSIREDRTTV
jgi:hypothetical protein